MSDQKIAVDSGQWLLYRYNPERTLVGENPLSLDSRTRTRKVKEFLQQQTRFKMLTKSKPEDAKRLWSQAQHDAEIRFALYEYLASRKIEQPPISEGDPEAKPERAGNVITIKFEHLIGWHERELHLDVAASIHPPAASLSDDSRGSRRNYLGGYGAGAFRDRDANLLFPVRQLHIARPGKRAQFPAPGARPRGLG